jgi:hypothetical protein
MRQDDQSVGGGPGALARLFAETVQTVGKLLKFLTAGPTFSAFKLDFSAITRGDLRRRTAPALEPLRTGVGDAEWYRKHTRSLHSRCVRGRADAAERFDANARSCTFFAVRWHPL